MRHSRAALAGLLSFAAPASEQLTPHPEDNTAVTIPPTPTKTDMRTKILLFALALVIATSLEVQAQYAERDSTFKRYFVGSTLFMLANFVPDNNPPEMVYVNSGYRITGKDVISLELKTWKYGWPIGIPFGKSFEAEGEGFPGYVREYGVSLNYQRFVRKGLFAQVDVMPALQTFVNEDRKKSTMAFRSSTPIPLVITSNSSRTGFFFNPQ